MATFSDLTVVRGTVLRLLHDDDYTSLTFERIADELQLDPHSLQAAWRSIPELVFTVLVNGEPMPAPPNLGSFDEEFGLVVREVITRWSQPGSATTLVNVLADLVADPQLRERFIPRLVTRHLTPVQMVLERAVWRGELPRVPNLTEVHAVLTGPILTLVSLHSVSIDDATQHRLGAALTAAVRALAEQS